MPNPTDLAEAYNALGQLNTLTDKATGELKKNLADLDARYTDLGKQLAEARDMQDHAAINRLEPLVEQVQEAWVIANMELRDTLDGKEDSQSPATTTAATPGTSPSRSTASTADPSTGSPAGPPDAPSPPDESGSPGAPPSTTAPEPTPAT